jgi:hypothetical protein
LAGVEGLVNGSKNLVVVDVMDTLGLLEQLLAKARMCNIDEGLCSVLQVLPMQIGDTVFRKILFRRSQVMKEGDHRSCV